MEMTPSCPSEAILPEAPRTRRGPTVEAILYIAIFLLAMATRFTLLDSQALHHDEGIHALYGWNIYQGRGWVHDAVYHGPMIYHMEALGFLLFGDSDATTRVMLATFSVATVMLPLLLRRELGRWGALLTSFLLLISPTFLYFGRFGHPDVFGAFWTLFLFICTMRYFAEHKNGWLYGAVVAATMHFCTKPTAYIALGIFLLYLGIRLLWERYDIHAFWPIVGIIPTVIEYGWRAVIKKDFPLAPVLELKGFSLSWFALIPLLLAGLAILVLLAWRWWEGWRLKKGSPTLDLVVVLGTMTLPLLSALPLDLLLRVLKRPPLSYNNPNIPEGVVPLAVIVIAGMFILSAVIGLLWDARRWAISAAIFWGVFFVLYTSFFNSMTGWATGLFQTLGFWLSQQDVKRIHVGPQYYFMLMSVYETVSFLLGTVAVFFFAWRGLARGTGRGLRPAARASIPKQAPDDEPAPPSLAEPVPPPLPLGAPIGTATGFLAFWAVAAFLLYSLAGEQVPWLNLHPTLPFALLAGTLLGRIAVYRPRRPQVEARRLWADRIVLALAAALLLWAGRPLLQAGPWWLIAAWLLSAAILWSLAYLFFSNLSKERWGDIPFLVLGAVALLMAILGANAVSFGQRYPEWLSIYVPLLMVAVALVARVILLGKAALRSGVALLTAFLCVYSFASAWRVTYINNDTPVEMIIYVQSSSDLQWAAEEIYTLSTLLTGGKDMAFLYDGEVAWPLEWYLRNYPRRSMQATIAGPPAEDVAMALVYRDKENTSAPYLEGRYAPTRFYAFNWWFPWEGGYTARNFVDWLAPEIGRAQEKVGLKEVVQALLTPAGQARFWRYYLFREAPAPLGAREFAVYVRRDLVGPLELIKDVIPRK